jgi:hypothetical protein
VRVALITVVLAGLALSGCTVVAAVHKAVNAVEGNKRIIDDFSSGLQSGAPSTFEATYSTTTGAPATVVYAVEPPKDVALTETQPGNSSNVDFIVNSTGEYLCTQGGGGSWSCQEGTGAAANEQQAIVDLYTPSHWVKFLDTFSLAAGFAGDKITTSSMSINGFQMSCVDFVASGVAGKSTICSTAQHLLGYVQFASSSTSFEITRYSTSPSSSLFTVPVGATITTVQIPTPTSSP